MGANDTGFLVGILQSVLSGKDEVDVGKRREVLGFGDDSEFAHFLDGCRQLARIGG